MSEPWHADRELAPIEVAASLGLSVEYVLREMDSGRLPARTCGNEKRVTTADLTEYLKQLQADREAALDEMADDARRLELNY